MLNNRGGLARMEEAQPGQDCIPSRMSNV